MKQTLITRTKKLINAIPENQIEEFTGIVRHYIVERNKEIIKKFEVGDEVSWFQSKSNEIFGTIKKINAATATIITEDNWQWDVPAHQLIKHSFLKG
jgi:hypothetical protein